MDLLERVAEALWPYLRQGMFGMENSSWESIHPDSLTYEMTIEAARAAIRAYENTGGFNAIG